MILLCKICGEEKEASSFSKKTQSSSGYSSKCKSCHNDYVRTVWYPKNRDKQIQASSQWREKNYIKDKASKYNITEEELKQMFASAENKCAICNTQTTKLAIDHCHKTGKVRGLLCRTCNVGLGHFRDNVSYLSNAIKYLRYLN